MAARRAVLSTTAASERAPAWPKSLADCSPQPDESGPADCLRVHAVRNVHVAGAVTTENLVLMWDGWPYQLTFPRLWGPTD